LEEELNKVSDLVGITDSNEVSKFEDSFASLIGDGKAVSFAAGRMGFYALMKVLSIKPGDDIIIQGSTCSVMVNAILKIGANPIFADIDKETFGSSYIGIEKCLSPRTKIIVAQHSFGIPCDIQPIVNLAKENKIFLLEDCALTLGSKINDKVCGNFGDASLFSTDHSKPLNLLIGGLIYSRNKILYNSLKKARDDSKELPKWKQKALWKQLLFERKFSNPSNYSKMNLMAAMRSRFNYNKSPFLDDDFSSSILSKYPYPSRLPTFLAKLGIYELKRWDEKKNIRKDLLITFLKLSNDYDIQRFLPKSYFDLNLDIVPLRFVYTHPSFIRLRKEMSTFLNIQWFWFTKPIVACEEPSELGYKYGSCPISEKVGNEIINWPCIFDNIDNNNLVSYFKKVHA